MQLFSSDWAIQVQKLRIALEQMPENGGLVQPTD